MTNEDLFARAEQLRKKKAVDYNTSIKLVDYFPNGIEDVAYMLHVKATRIRSLVHNARFGVNNNFEGLQDSLVDLVNYAKFADDIIRGELEGQKTFDIFDLLGKNE